MINIIKRVLKRLFMYSVKRDINRIIRIRDRYQISNSKFSKFILKCCYLKLLHNNNGLIPIAVTIGKNLRLPHGISGIFISAGTKIGDNCVIYQNVTIGSNTAKGSKRQGSPIIGNNVIIGTGAVIIGGVKIGNNVRIGANTTVVQDIPDNCTVVSAAGVRIIPASSDRDNAFIPYKDWIKTKDESL